MTTLKTVPDAEAIAIAYLMTVRDVTDLVGESIGPALPAPASEDDFPFLTVALAPSTTYLGRILTAALDVSAWGQIATPGRSTKGDTFDVAAIAHAALWDPAFVGTREGGVVAGIEDRVGVQWLPDPETSRPRYLFQIAATVHSLPD